MVVKDNEKGVVRSRLVLAGFARMGPVLVLVAVSLLAGCWLFDRWHGADLLVPVGYAIDSVGALANSLALAEGADPWRYDVPRLNAPFGANWNENPLAESMIYLLYGGLLRGLPPGAAQHAMIALALVTAVLGGYGAARWMGASRVPAATAGLLFGFSHYVVFRAAGHLSLAFVGHVPLMLAWVHRLFQGEPVSRRAALGACGLAVVSAVMNPYYGFLFAFLMGCSGLILMVRRAWWRAAGAAGLAGLWAVALALNLAGYWRNLRENGPNPYALDRALPDLERWGLRLGDLFWPLAHPIEGWSRAAAQGYFGGGIVADEHAAAFLGVAGLVAVGLLLGHALLRLAQGRIGEVSTEAWCALFALAYGVQGGLNQALGSFGFVYLRATNRYSIVLLAAGLLFAARWLTARTGPLRAGLIGAALVGIHAAELRVSERRMAGETKEANRAMLARDRDFGARLEAALPHAAMVFQLPVWDYPEAGYRHLFRDYDHFRPYIWTEHLRFSHGACKGRVREAWQREVEALPPAELVRRLEAYGFAAVYINRDAYPDGTAGLEAALVAAGGMHLAESGDGVMVAYRLTPHQPPELPRAAPGLSFGKGFYPQGVPPGPAWHRWTSGPARLLVQRGDEGPATLAVSMMIRAEHGQAVEFRSGDRRWWRGELEPGVGVPVRWLMPVTEPVAEVDLIPDVPSTANRTIGNLVVGVRLEQPAVRMATNAVELGGGFHEWDVLPDGRRIAWSHRPEGAELLVAPQEEHGDDRVLAFGVAGPSAMQVRVARDGEVVWSGAVAAGEPTEVRVAIPPRERWTRITLDSNAGVRRWSPGDARTLSFAVAEVHLRAADDP